jgi:chemotaxis protein MotB
VIAALNHTTISFASASSEVPAEAAASLKSAAKDIRDLPKGRALEIAGYTDSSGNPEKNVTLSQRRAEAVRRTLIEGGANPDRLIAKGYGSADPIASNDTPEGRLRNRRIAYRIISAR